MAIQTGANVSKAIVSVVVATYVPPDALTLVWLSPIRQGGEARLALSGAAPGAGLVWRVAEGAGSLVGASPHADDGGSASARYQAAESSGAAVRIEVDVYA